MAEINISVKLRVSEINVIGEALTTYREFQRFNATAVNSTNEEKREAAGKFIQVEGIMRSLDIEIPDDGNRSYISEYIREFYENSKKPVVTQKEA